MRARAPSDREVVEMFHLEFVRMLASSSQKAHYAIKGGCNLRFFFGSVRYSEDIDLDVTVTSKETLEKQVDNVFKSQSFERLLRMRGIAIQEWTKPKQTATVQRWKATLTSTERAVQQGTKIEFSHRPSETTAVLDPIDKSLLDLYRMPPLNARHYPRAAAIRQKIEALVGRNEVQARDVFDLDVLIGSADTNEFADLRDLSAVAIERALEITYDQFASHVVAYLMPEHATLYGSKDAWDSMQLHVVDFLETISR
jgi:hypothetical protein